MKQKLTKLSLIAILCLITISFTGQMTMLIKPAFATGGQLTGAQIS